MASVLPAISFVASSKDVARRPAAHRARKLHRALQYFTVQLHIKLQFCTAAHRVRQLQLHYNRLIQLQNRAVQIAIPCNSRGIAMLHTGPTNCTVLRNTFQCNCTTIALHCLLYTGHSNCTALQFNWRWTQSPQIVLQYLTLQLQYCPVKLQYHVLQLQSNCFCHCCLCFSLSVLFHNILITECEPYSCHSHN